MKKIILMAICFACCSTIMAQQAKIGFFSMQDLLNTDVTYQEDIRRLLLMFKSLSSNMQMSRR